MFGETGSSLVAHEETKQKSGSTGVAMLAGG